MKRIFLSLLLAAGSAATAQTTDAVADVPKDIFTTVEKSPEFPGGVPELARFLSKHISYPKIALDSAYSGRCYLKFVVDTAGYIRHATVIKGVPKCPECDREALRVVQAMPRWKPGRQNGKAVNAYYYLPVFFQMQ